MGDWSLHLEGSVVNLVQETVDSNATAFALTRQAVAQHEEGKIDSKFAIGDALLVEIGVPGSRAAETQSKLKKCSEYLLDLGYQYEVKTLDAIRRVAHAYPVDERGDLLHSMRRPSALRTMFGIGWNWIPAV